jgi:hypothetical protein
VGDKNVISGGVVGKDKYEAGSMTFHSTTHTHIVDDQSRKIVECAYSGKRIYFDDSVQCPECRRQVAKEYYIERSKRCEKCEQEAQETYKVFVATIVGGKGPIDASHKQQLDAEAKRLKIDSKTQAAILRSSHKRSTDASSRLSSVQRAELDTAVERFMRADDLRSKSQITETFAALHENSTNEEVSFWYFLASAITDPERSAAYYEDELTDNYWQRYWGFLAYCNMDSPKGGGAVDRFRSVFGEQHPDDAALAEATYFLARGFDSFDNSMLERARTFASSVKRDGLSAPLTMLYDALARLVKQGIQSDAKYSVSEWFVFLNIFRARRYVQYLADAQAEKERERAAAKQASQKRDAVRTATVTAAPQSHPGPGSVQAKDFAGYETMLPVRKSKWKRNLLIAVIILVALIGILFLIPAPDSW